MSSVTDNFSAMPLDSQWFLPQGDNCVSTSADTLVAAPPSSAHPTIGAGNYRSVANPGSASFRCFNLGPPCS